MKVRFIFIGLFVWGLSHFAQEKTDRFTLSKISTLFLEEPTTVCDPSLLLQPYHYLGKGGQSYVFISRDGQYVLKCFRGSRYALFKGLNTVHPHFERKKNAAKKNLQSAMKSYALAFQKLRKETGLLAIHLDNHTSISTPIQIIDKNGICHIVDSNRIPFVIQKKALLVKEKVDLAKKDFSALFALIQSRIEKKIEDSDPNLAKNFGFLGDSAIQIDAGRFSFCEHPSQKPLEQSKEDLQHWINAHHPELSKDFQMLYDEFCHAVF